VVTVLAFRAPAPAAAPFVTLRLLPWHPSRFDNAIFLGGKADHVGRICERAAWVIAGNEHLAAFARQFTPRVTVIPTVNQVDELHDLATLKTTEAETPPRAATTLPEVGEQLVFAGLPQGLTKASVFPGMVSAVGSGLVSRPQCDLIQTNIKATAAASPRGGPVPLRFPLPPTSVNGC
jgi:hypothetical protein